MNAVFMKTKIIRRASFVRKSTIICTTGESAFLNIRFFFLWDLAHVQYNCCNVNTDHRIKKKKINPKCWVNFNKYDEYRNEEGKKLFLRSIELNLSAQRHLATDLKIKCVVRVLINNARFCWRGRIAFYKCASLTTCEFQNNIKYMRVNLVWIELENFHEFILNSTHFRLVLVIYVTYVSFMFIINM